MFTVDVFRGEIDNCNNLNIPLKYGIPPKYEYF